MSFASLLVVHRKSNHSIEFQSKSSLTAASNNNPCLVESTHTVSQQVADQYQLYQQLPDGHVQVYKLPAGIVPILVPTGSDHVKQDHSNLNQTQFQGHSQNSNNIANNSSSIPTMNCTLVNKPNNAGQLEYSDSIISFNTSVSSSCNEDKIGKLPVNFQEEISVSANGNIQGTDNRGALINTSIQSLPRTTDINNSNDQNKAQLEEKGLKMEFLPHTSVAESTLLEHTCDPSQSHTQYLPTAYIPENSQKNVATFCHQNTPNVSHTNLNTSLLANQPVVHCERAIETQYEPSMGVSNQNLDSKQSDQGTLLSQCTSHNVSKMIPEPTTTMQPNKDDTDFPSTLTAVQKTNTSSSHVPLTQVDMNLSQVAVVSDKLYAESNATRSCLLLSEPTQKTISIPDNPSHQQLCETCGSISVVSEDAIPKPTSDFHNDKSMSEKRICSKINPLECTASNLSRDMSKPALIAPQNTPVHPVKSYTPQTQVIELDGMMSDQISSTSKSSVSGIGDKMALKKDEIHEDIASSIGGPTVSHGMIVDVFTSITSNEPKRKNETYPYLFL